MPFIFMTLPMLFGLGIMGSAFYLGFRFLRAFEARGGNRTELEELRSRLARIEESMESMGTDVERIAEAQQFTTKLLGDRTPADTSTG